MKFYEEFAPTPQSFYERIGAPTEFDAAIGRIALAFSCLEDTARNLIVFLAGTDRRTGHTLVAQLSFRRKLEILESLVVHRLESSSDVDLKEQIGEMFVLCRRSEELRNTYLHSSYTNTLRVKFSAKAKRGLSVHKEPVNPALLLDVADFIGCAAGEIEGVPILLGFADTMRAGRDYISYYKGDIEVTTFRFGEVE